MNIHPIEILNLLLDVRCHTKWVYNTLVSVPIKVVSDTELYYYGETYAPWPVSNRDLVLHVKGNIDYANEIIEINVHSTPGLIPEKKGKVRVPRSHSHWIIKKTPQGCAITYTLDIDPGGRLPAWLVNFASVEGPFLSFTEMKKILTSGQYNKKFSPALLDNPQKGKN